MNTNAKELNPEEMEQIIGGWSLKSLWPKIKRLFVDDDENEG